MQRTELYVFLQGLQGAQAVVVLAFLALRSAMCLKDLRKVTGKSPEALTGAVDGLEGKGFLVRQVGAHGKPYWLPMSDSFFGVLGQIPVKAESGSDVVVDSLLVLNLPSDSTTTTTTARQIPVKAESGKGEVISRISTHKSEAEIAECLAVLKELGIHGRKAEHLALYDWTDPDYIRGHVAAAFAEVGKWEKPLSAAIYLMENNFPVPELHENGHSMLCTCAFCRAGDFRKVVSAGNSYRSTLWDLDDPDQDPADEEVDP